MPPLEAWYIGSDGVEALDILACPRDAAARPSNVAGGAQRGFTRKLCSIVASSMLKRQMQRICKGITRKELANALEIGVVPRLKATWT